MYTLIAFATQWGSRHGGINSFNADFLIAFGVAYHQNAQIVCVVTEAPPEAVSEAASAHIKLLPLPYVPEERSFNSSIGEIAVDLLSKSHIKFDPDRTIWLGHDLITGEAAVAAAKSAGGRSAVIHHMSYSDYESVAEDSQSAQAKTEQQTVILENADLVLAIGPLLRDAATDRVSPSKPIRMLIPGLAEIDPQEAPKTFVAFLSGRLTADAARIKQGHLGVAAFAAAGRMAREHGGPDALRKQPKLLLRGVDFEDRFSAISPTPQDAETHLKKFAEQYAEAVINLHALPYTEDRQQLYRELSRSSVALMPSWHEGFGLVAWEAIAGGVPLILGENSGVYRFLEEEHPGAEKGYVYSVDVKAQSEFPYFRNEDLEATVEALKTIAADPAKARKRASSLRNLLLEKNSWVSCCEEVVAALDWDLQKGSLGDRSSVIIQQITEPIHSSGPPVDVQPELLNIPQKQWRAGTGMADSQLLRAEEAVLPFDAGREGEVEELKKWINDTTWPITVRLITGAGGQGKTRLAIHVCQEARHLGWYAGFLDTNLDPNRMKTLWTDLRSLNQPTLIVIDYAETRQIAFLSLLKSVRQNPGNEPLRILLLAREGGEWWDNLPSRDPQCEALLNGYATTGPFKLAALYVDQNERQTAFQKALYAFAEILSVEPTEVIPQLAGDQFQRPLFVQMAALLALHGERPLTAQGLTKALLNHERRYWLGLLAPFNWTDAGQRAEQLLALATLTGGFPTAKTAEAYWTAGNGTVLSLGEFNTLFRSMATLYPGAQGLQALRPDLLGEALVAQALLRPEGEILLDAVLSSSATQFIRRHALTVLARLSTERVDVDEILLSALTSRLGHIAADLVAVSTETTSRLPELAELAFGRLSPAMKNQVAGSLKQSLELGSIQLSGLNRQVFEHLAERARDRMEKRPSNTDRMFDYAEALYNYALALNYVGAYGHACSIAQEAMPIVQRLISKDRSRYEDFYARSLSNYASYLTKAGRNEEALTTARSALEIHARLVARYPNNLQPAYAKSLNNYANRLRDLGKIEQALEHSQKALDIYEQLAEKGPEQFEPDYAIMMNNYANFLRESGDYNEALIQGRKSLEIRKRLAQKRPDHFEDAYANSLTNYANYLSDRCEFEEALINTGNALNIYKRLVNKNPDRFEPEYALSIQKMANILTDLGQYVKALSYAEEAVQIHRRLAEKKPEQHQRDYAESLESLASILCDAAAFEEGLEYAREALEIREQLAKRNAGRFDADYAESLNSYASHLNTARRTHEMLSYAERALTIYKQLIEKDSDRFEPSYAAFLSTHATYLDAAGQMEEALAYTRMGLKINRRLAEKNPKLFEAQYADSLDAYASCLVDAGKIKQALDHTKEALEIRTRLAQQLPKTFAGAIVAGICFVSFLSWLSDEQNGDLNSIRTTAFSLVPTPQQGLIQLFWEFVQGCRASASEIRRDRFHSILSIWSDLRQSDRPVALPYWLCAAAWCSEYESMPTESWLGEWVLYSMRRDGKVPFCISEVARRLDFSFSKSTT
jgi:glycosyltransferase involved in cell wall biosynthesis